MLHENDIEGFFGNLGEPGVGMLSRGLASGPPSVTPMILSRERRDSTRVLSSSKEDWAKT